MVAAAALAAWLLLGRDTLPPQTVSPEAPSFANDSLSSREGSAGVAGDSAAAADDAAELPGDAATTMTLRGGDVSLSYPDDFGMAVNQDQLLVSSTIPVCSSGFDYCIYLNSGEYDGTNFEGAGLGIVIRGDLDYEAACALEQPEGFSELEPVVEGGVDHVTSVFDEVGEGAAGHFTNGAVYRLYFADTCYEFESRVAQAQFSNFEPGAVERFGDEALDDVLTSLTDIVESVELPDGRDGLWSRDLGSDTLVEDIQVRGVEPAAGSSVSSPIELTGEALGVWFFEGTFPYRLQTESGDVLASGAVEAEGDWMTTDFVPFGASIEYDVATETPGRLVLMNDNPSGLPENDASLTIPLTLSP